MATALNNYDSGTYFGLSNIEVGDETIDYPRGIKLRRTYAYLMHPSVMAFVSAEEGKPHPPPWKETRRQSGYTITAELFVPATAAQSLEKRIELAQTVDLLLKMWATPEVEILTGSNMPYSEIVNASNAEATIIEMPIYPKPFRLLPAKTSDIAQVIMKTVEQFETTHRLFKESPEFRLAATALSMGQTHSETSLTMVSLWGALEAIFSPSSGELRFRVSALIAAYLYPPGRARLEQQRSIAKLYDRRSAAAHGRPNHSGDDLLKTFELLRAVLFEFIHQEGIPSSEELAERLFGAT